MLFRSFRGGRAAPGKRPAGERAPVGGAAVKTWELAEVTELSLALDGATGALVVHGASGVLARVPLTAARAADAERFVARWRERRRGASATTLPPSGSPPTPAEPTAACAQCGAAIRFESPSCPECGSPQRRPIAGPFLRLAIVLLFLNIRLAAFFLMWVPIIHGQSFSMFLRLFFRLLLNVNFWLSAFGRRCAFLDRGLYGRRTEPVSAETQQILYALVNDFGIHIGIRGCFRRMCRRASGFKTVQRVSGRAAHGTVQCSMQCKAVGLLPATAMQFL